MINYHGFDIISTIMVFFVKGFERLFWVGIHEVSPETPRGILQVLALEIMAQFCSATP